MKISNNTNKEEGSLLKRQLIVGASLEGTEIGIDISNDYNFGEEDLKVISPLIKDSLTKKGYLIISDSTFSNKMANIFGLKDKQSRYIRFNQRAGNCPNPSPNTPDFDLFNIYVDTENKILFSELFLPELIDYRKEYPEVAQIEDTMSTKSSKYENVTIIRWKDISKLDKQRISNWDLLYHRNKYLFNDNKASLTWLLNNDKAFTTSLLTEFGYDKEPKINEFVLKEIYQRVKTKNDDIHYNYSDYDGLLYTRSCDGKLKIHEGVLSTLKYITNTENNEYLNMLREYLVNIDAGSLQTDLSEEEKIQLYCIFGRTELDILKKYPYVVGGAYAQISMLLAGYQDKYKEVAKQNNIGV